MPKKPRVRWQWTQPEDDQLSELIGDYPPEMLYAHYRRWARREGMPLRTDRAIRFRIYHHHKASLVPIGIFLRASDLSRHLQLDNDKVSEWIRQGLVPSRYVTRSGIGVCVRREGIRHLARTHPRKFINLSKDDLFLLLENDELAEQVMEANRDRRSYRVPVVCLTTGRRFPSIKAAARAAHINPPHLARKVRSGQPTTVCDLQWIRA